MVNSSAERMSLDSHLKESPLYFVPLNCVINIATHTPLAQLVIHSCYVPEYNHIILPYLTENIHTK